MKFKANEQALKKWLQNLAKNWVFLAPKPIGKSIIYKEYSEEELNNTSFSQLVAFTTTSAKSAYIPQSEVLFSYKGTKDPENLAKVNISLEVPEEVKPTLIFGARACDAKGVEVLDKAYLEGKYKDPYYAKKRENTLMIAQTCDFTLPSCFCNWTDTDLTNPIQADIAFTSVGADYILQGNTEKGNELLKTAGFSEASEADLEQVATKHTKAKTTLPQKPELSQMPQVISYQFENADFWSNVSAACIGCNSCTFVCPTCQCFNITDEGNPLEGKRIRSWASCISDEFTREASGHNPRNAGFMRWRNRLGHKFSYVSAWHTNLFACTGCGRCLNSCPATISIKDMLTKILSATPKDAKLPAAKHFGVHSTEKPAKNTKSAKKENK